MKEAFTTGQTGPDHEKRNLYLAHKTIFSQFLVTGIGEHFTKEIEDPNFQTEYQAFVHETLPNLRDTIQESKKGSLKQQVVSASN